MNGYLNINIIVQEADCTVQHTHRSWDSNWSIVFKAFLLQSLIFRLGGNERSIIGAADRWRLDGTTINKATRSFYVKKLQSV